MRRWPLSLLGLALFGAACLATACSETSRYRVLKFLFDGVPEPGKLAAASESSTEAGEGDTLAAAPGARTARVELFAHPPYRQNRCVSCHNANDGTLVEEGGALCLRCHRDVPGDVRYVHGPVAVGACRYCHNPHASPYPGMLNKEASELCLSCHDGDDLTAGAHHENVDATSCTRCHNAHGGPDRFFLRPTDS